VERQPRAGRRRRMGLRPGADRGAMLGVDETRARSVRWLLSEAGWRRSDPWMTSFVDLDPTHPGGLLGLAPGRSGASVRTCSAHRDRSLTLLLITIILRSPSSVPLPITRWVRDANDRKLVLITGVGPVPVGADA